MRLSGLRIALALSMGIVPAASGAALAAQPGLDQLQVIMEVYMVEGETAVEAESVPVLENFLEQALKRTGDRIELIGHTDNRNSPAEELAESEKWANALGQYLVSKGISADRISVGGKGATEPRVVVEPGTRERVNRRVNMTLGEKRGGW